MSFIFDPQFKSGYSVSIYRIGYTSFYPYQINQYKIPITILALVEPILVENPIIQIKIDVATSWFLATLLLGNF